MRSDHPAPEMLDRLVSGELTDEERKWAVAHLLGRCEVCRRYLRGVLHPVFLGEEAGGYDRVFADSLAIGIAGEERAEAEQLAAEVLWVVIDGMGPAQRLRVVTGNAGFHTWAMASRCLEEAAEFHWGDSLRGLQACRLALAIAERLPEAEYPDGLAADLRGRALGCLAYELRLDGQLVEAEAALGDAWEALEDGTCDPLEHAGLLRVAASLALGGGDLAAAAADLRTAASIYRLYGDRHLEGRTLQKLALVVGFDQPAKGVEIATRALGLIDPAREPRVELAARHALIWFLNDCGRCTEAIELLERSLPMYRKLERSQPPLLLAWLEARICRRVGDLEAAERGLTAVWHELRADGFPQDLTQVTLDLAEVCLARGKNRQAMRLLKTFHRILGRWGMHEEGMAAWLLLVRAAAREAAGGGGGARPAGRAGGKEVGGAQALTREAARYFRVAWRRAVAFPGR